ncbi:hypothetical protein [Streptomyces sp. NBC_00576]|uniref:hypothetical protein n=1 Tax=Streptomyces sp. NBC_00576 TaxID=2903665 RepID=UPI002E81255B|nr:hypothetical protein [Streptomyces sp. NBC_00576]WUB74871.1 hypothetical protein OG734_35145 [Streptomyces sp. NBC_00576]
MNDASTMQPLSADAHEATGHSNGHGTSHSDGYGKHRGPVSAHNDEATPHGRHRKPSEQAENRA